MIRSAFLQVALVPENELRCTTLSILYDIIDAQVKSCGDLKQVEEALIDALDAHVDKTDKEWRLLFNTAEHLKQVLSTKVAQQTPPWHEEGSHFILRISKLCTLLSDYRMSMNGDDNRDKLRTSTYALLNFYREIGRQTLYKRYINRLVDLHIVGENFTEAAFVLKMHADELTWEENCQLKEKLYLTMIDYFDQGRTWPEGLPLLKQLTLFYESNCNIEKLSSVLKTYARFLDNILTKIPASPEYFRVSFIGDHFSAYYKNKQFVVRGIDFERLQEFKQRIQTEFPSAEILSKHMPPNNEGKYIHIVSVRPIPLQRPHLASAPEKMHQYYSTNNVTQFTFDRPVQRPPIDEQNEFKSLWIERTKITVAESLPGVLRWSQVVECNVQELSPIEHAIESVDSMNQELTKLITSYTRITEKPTSNLNPLTMRLQGVIDAAVNGGVAKYIDAFLKHNDHNNANLIQSDSVSKLKQCILQTVRILEGGLSLHNRLVPTELRPLHNHLVQQFQMMRGSFLEATKELRCCETKRRPSILSQPLPPIPKDNTGFDDHNMTPSVDDNIYCVPEESNNVPRPHSAGHDQHQQLRQSVQRSRSIPRNHHVVNLYSPSITEPLPPIPPRSSTLERPSRHSSNSDDGAAPALPRRNSRCDQFKLISIDIDASSSDPPPPLPVKQRSLSNALPPMLHDYSNGSSSLLD